MHSAPSGLTSISVMKFGPENVLFVGDSRAATLFAFELGAAGSPREPRPYNLHAIDQKIADLLGAPLDQISIRDMVVQPSTGEAYVGVHRGHGTESIALIVRINQSGEIHVLPIESIAYSKYELPNAVSAEIELWNHVAARSLSITDIEFFEGEVLVAGLSNADFSSTLYRIPYPFRDAACTSSIEMYHAAHAQTETRAPIQTMAVVRLGEKSHVLAAYTCTPLVTIPIDALADKAHVKGKTIGELGYGSAPIDMIHFRSFGMQGEVQDNVLITNRYHGAMIFDVKALAERNEQAGMSERATEMIVAPKHQVVPFAGVFHVDDQDPRHLAILRRDMETGRLDLLSVMKGIYARVSAFPSEYMMPGFPFDKLPQQFQQMYAMMKQNEGF